MVVVKLIDFAINLMSSMLVVVCVRLCAKNVNKSSEGTLCATFGRTPWRATVVNLHAHPLVHPLELPATYGIECRSIGTKH